MRRRPLLLASEAWLAARRASAQGAARRVGVLSIAGVSAQQAEMSLYFRDQLQQAGWELGRNLLGDVRHAEGDLARAQMLGEQLAAGHPDLLIGFGNDAIAALQRATRRIPIVMGFGHEPVAAGFVQSPGGVRAESGQADSARATVLPAARFVGEPDLAVGNAPIGKAGFATLTFTC